MYWIKPKDEMPKPYDLVLVALFDVKQENFQYYVGWYSDERKEWYLTDYGYSADVAYWMAIPKLTKGDN